MNCQSIHLAGKQYKWYYLAVLNHGQEVIENNVNGFREN
jgi:hypothetical protein